MFVVRYLIFPHVFRHWYRLLDRLFPGAAVKNVVSCVLCFAPLGGTLGPKSHFCQNNHFGQNEKNIKKGGPEKSILAQEHADWCKNVHVT